MLLLYLYFNILLLLSYFLYLLYTVNQFSFTHFRYCVSTFSYKHMPQCKFSLYLKKAGLASRNIVLFLKKVILRCIGLCFNYHHLYLLSRLDQPLIQRIPAGLSSAVACLDIIPFNLRKGMNMTYNDDICCYNSRVKLGSNKRGAVLFE